MLFQCFLVKKRNLTLLARLNVCFVFYKKVLNPIKTKLCLDVAIFEKKKQYKRAIYFRYNSRKRLWENAIAWTATWLKLNACCLILNCVYFLKIHCWVCCTLFRLFSIGYILVALIVTQQPGSVHNCSLRQTKLEWVLYDPPKRLLSKKTEDMVMKKNFVLFYWWYWISAIYHLLVCCIQGLFLVLKYPAHQI